MPDVKFYATCPRLLIPKSDSHTVVIVPRGCSIFVFHFLFDVDGSVIIIDCLIYYYQFKGNFIFSFLLCLLFEQIHSFPSVTTEWPCRFWCNSGRWESPIAGNFCYKWRIINRRVQNKVQWWPTNHDHAVRWYCETRRKADCEGELCWDNSTKSYIKN